MATGYDYLLLKGLPGSETEIIGQLDGTMTVININPEITNKANGGSPDYLGVAVGRQVTFAGTYTQINTSLLNEVKAQVESGAKENYLIQGLDGEEWSGSFIAGGRSDTAPLNGAATMAVTFSSAGGYDYTAPTNP